MGEHDWFTYRGMTCCRLCGILKRIGAPNSPCRGPIRVTTRGGDQTPFASEGWSQQAPHADDYEFL